MTVWFGLSAPEYGLRFLKESLQTILNNQGWYDLLNLSFDLTAIGITKAVEDFCRKGHLEAGITFMWVTLHISSKSGTLPKVSCILGWIWLIEAENMYVHNFEPCNLFV